MRGTTRQTQKKRQYEDIFVCVRPQLRQFLLREKKTHNPRAGQLGNENSLSAGNNCISLFLIFFITYFPESCQHCLLLRLIATKTRAKWGRGNLLHLWVACMSLHTPALHLHPRFPSFVCMSFGPHLEAEWRWREREKKTWGRKRGRRGKPVQQV